MAKKAVNVNRTGKKGGFRKSVSEGKMLKNTVFHKTRKSLNSQFSDKLMLEYIILAEMSGRL